MTEKTREIPTEEKIKESPYNEKELKWLREQEAEYFRLKKIWDVPEDQEETEEIREAKRRSLEILTAVKKLKIEREPEEYEKKLKAYKVDISKYESVSGAIDISGKAYFGITKKDGRYITDGKKMIEIKEEFFSGPHEYKGKLAYMTGSHNGKKRILDEDGKIVRDDIPSAAWSFDVIDDKIYITEQVSLTEYCVVDEDGKISPKRPSEVKEVKKVGDKVLIVHKSSIKTPSCILDFEKELISIDKGHISSPIIFEGEVIFARSAKDSRGNFYKEIINKSKRRIVDDKYSDVKMEGFGEDFVYATRSTGGFSTYQIRSYKKGRIFLEHFNHIYEIKRVRGNYGYILGRKNNEIVKQPFNLDDYK